MIGEKKLYIFSSVFLAFAASVCLIFGAQVASKGYVKVGGYSVFRVITGSMEPTISTGAVLLCKETMIEQIETDDIVCYRTKIPEIYGSIVTHRVISVIESKDAAVYLETKGDANVSSDPYYVDASNLIGRVVWYSGTKNLINDVLSFLSGEIGFLVCIVLPILVVSGMVMQSAVKNLQKDLALVKSKLNLEAVSEEAEIEKSQLLPGYTTLTYADYEHIYETLKNELLEELNGKKQGD